MTEIVIKNKYFLGHYDYITVWAADKEYHLKYNSEFTFLTSKKEEEIVISLFFFKSRKMIIDCSEKNCTGLELKSDIKKNFYIKFIKFIYKFYGYVSHSYHLWN